MCVCVCVCVCVCLCVCVYIGAENLAKQDVLHHLMQRAPLLCEADQVVYFLIAFFFLIHFA